ncbi:unnamed protein product [Urochloa humidicola]
MSKVERICEVYEVQSTESEATEAIVGTVNLGSSNQTLAAQHATQYEIWAWQFKDMTNLLEILLPCLKGKEQWSIGRCGLIYGLAVSKELHLGYMY